MRVGRVPMTEMNERIAALETKMAYALDVLAKREEYQSSVLKALTVIEMKQDQALNYQKTCDAERSAHGTRIAAVENAQGLEKNFRTTLRIQAVGIAGVGSFVVSVLTILTLLHRP